MVQGLFAPLSHGQRRFWDAERTLPGKADNRMAFAAVMSGEVDIMTAQAAFSVVVRRHELLRSRYDPSGTGQHVTADEPRLIVLPTPTTAESPSSLADGVLAPWWAMPIELSQESPIRGWAVTVSSGRLLLVFGVHHIAFDGWSRSIFLRDLARACQALLAGISPYDAIPAVANYRDFVRWESERLESWRGADVPFWRELLSDRRPALYEPMDAPQGERTEHTVSLAAGSVRALRRKGLAAAFVTAAARAISRVRDCGAFHFETMSSGRFEPRFGDTVGCFVNHLVLPFDRTDRIRDVGGRLYEAYRHARTPVEEVGAELPHGVPSTQVCLILNQQPPAMLGMEVVETRVPRSSVPLLIEANPRPDGSWSLYAGYRTDAMPSTEAHATLDLLVRQLNGIAEGRQD
jgi:mycobactin peptide synthetase MbtE